MNSGVSKRSQRRGRSVEVVSYAALMEAARRDPASVERLARTMNLDVAGLNPHEAATRIVRWLKRNPQPNVSKR